jgi:translation initiation factor IF-2
MKVFEVAKRLGVTMKEMKAVCEGLGITVKSNFVALSDEQIAKVREAFAAGATVEVTTLAGDAEAAPTAKAEQATERALTGDPEEDAVESPEPETVEEAPVEAEAPAEAPAKVPTEEAPVEETPVAEEKVEEKKPRRRKLPAPIEPAPPKKEEKPAKEERRRRPADAESGRRTVTPSDVRGGRGKPSDKKRGGKPEGDGPRRRQKGSGGRNAPTRIRTRTGRTRTTRGKVVARRDTPAPQDAFDREVEIRLPISIKDFSQEIGIKANEIVKKLFENGIMATINQALDSDTVEYLAVEFERKVKIKEATGVEDIVIEHTQEDDKPEDLEPRAPVVTFMGHVDHGKTSLLDYIRDTRVASGESGGITQHIGAYKVHTEKGSVVFLDTPGHAAFTAMRARGANTTDVTVLVVAANDGVMPQTEEAIDHAKAAECPIVVAINKCDLPDANPDRVKGRLAELGLQSEDWGGETTMVHCSAITGEGVDDLLELLVLETELLELRANPKKSASGVIIEVKMIEGRGTVATVLVMEGTLKVGDAFIAGSAYGKVRALVDDRGQQLKEAGPATPIEISGFNGIPETGNAFQVVKDIKVAKEVADKRTVHKREVELANKSHVTLENLFDTIQREKIREVNVIIKADVKGSVEVLNQTLQNLATEEVAIKIIHSGVGEVNESDVLLADASDAIILGFHITAEDRARTIAHEKGVEVRTYEVIYNVIDDMKAALSGLLEPDRVEEIIGGVEIREVFKTSRFGNIAGCYVTSGKIDRTAMVKLIRDGAVIWTGSLDSLKRFKDDAKEVAEGYECGLRLAGYNDIKVGDRLEAFHVREVARELE